MSSSRQQLFQGFLMAIGAAVFWGISGTCAQYLFDSKGVDPAWLVSWRMLIAGAILLAFAATRRNPDWLHIWRNRKDSIRLLVFSVFGMVTVQYTYFYSISLSNAATATVLQYMGPLFVVAYYALKQRRWPNIVEYLALALALGGTFLLVTHGNPGELVISEKALFWGIISALALAIYTIQPVQLLKRYSATTVTGWGMFIGGIIFSLFSQPWNISGQWDLQTWGALAYIILFGTVIAFSIFLSSLNKIGAQTASLLCSVEPLSAATVAVIWLSVPFGKMDWLGTACILLTVSILTLAQPKAPK